MKRFSALSAIALAAFSVILIAPATSAQIINPTLASSANLNTDFANFNEANLTTQVGLSSPVNTGDTLASASTVTHDGNFGGLWGTNDNYTNSAPRPTFVWDLGSVTNVSNIVLWQFYGGTLNGNPNQLNNFTLRFSTTTTFTGGAAFSGVLAPNISTAQVFNFTETGRYVEMTAVDNLSNGDRIGFAQVRFAGTAVVVPEAGSLALLAPALIGLGVVVIRRKR